MNSTVKTLLPIGLVVALVFGVTVISQFTPPGKPAETGDDPAAEGDPVEMPRDTVFYDPYSPDPVLRAFPGVFEIGSGPNLVAFPLRNPRPTPLKLSPLLPSCTKCTSARGAAIPPEALRAFVGQAVAPLPLPVPSLLGPLAWAELYTKLDWHQFDFARPDHMLTVPGATADGPAWALVELGFKVGAATAVAPVYAPFDLYDGGGKKLMQQPLKMTVAFAGKEPFEVSPLSFPLGEFPEGGAPKTFYVFCWSATRELGQFPPPAVAPLAADPGVVVSAPVAMTADELAGMTAALEVMQAEGSKDKPPPPLPAVRSGYKLTVTVSRPAEIGKFTKDLFAAAPVTTRTYRLEVSGTATGFIRLESGSAVELGRYDSAYEYKKTVRVWADRAGAELELLPDLCKPGFARYALDGPRDEAGRRVWNLTVTVAAKEGRSPPWEGAAVLRSKGPNPVTIRIPVTGHGR